MFGYLMKKKSRKAICSTALTLKLVSTQYMLKAAVSTLLHVSIKHDHKMFLGIPTYLRIISLKRKEHRKVSHGITVWTPWDKADSNPVASAVTRFLTCSEVHIAFICID